MVTNLVHLRTAITQSCVTEVFSRVRRSSKGAGGGSGPRLGKNDLKDVVDGGSGCFSCLLLHFAALQLL